jgi:xanthine dehydrogenase YagR molybdenum-binding subunit
MSPAAVRVTIDRRSEVRVAVAAHDVGTGAYTVIAQMAATRLGVPLSNVRVDLGDSELPPGPVAGGSITTASVCSAVLKACDAIREKLGVAGELSGEALDRAFAQRGVGVIEQYTEWTPDGAKPGAMKDLFDGKASIVGGPMQDRISFAFGAEFVELRIHDLTREIRVPRMVGAFAAGHIMNPRTARSQLMGGMIWGIGSALHEETELDKGRARYVNDNLADYLVPVNADIGDVEIILVPEEDTKVNPAGVKGLGELANVGTAAAISNAVFHATGKRIRKLPIRIEDLLEA